MTRPRPAAPDWDRIAELAAALGQGREVARADVKQAVLATLRELARLTPGASVEVRVPPYGAVQAVAGVRHRRGTPPAVVETDPATWLALACGQLDWAHALATGRIAATGTRADLSPHLPLPHLPPDPLPERPFGKGNMRANGTGKGPFQ